ncbi:GroEL apical domain-like protein [Auricularia subglabra TFB-10046 SS5]|uniref:GroEL apical domain-like protein n=1 Tax=Auricularia subglabra (strain TFB-10046 / SS5) TaxID=717982 RepID=J0D4Q0_AURST|nr:GroEL apical domain-like protein [Auricularia subglabra TFB-10046 SS5]
MDLRRGAQTAVDKVMLSLVQRKREITTSEKIVQVATISTNDDTHAQMVEFDKPPVLLSEKISLLQGILPSLEAGAQARRPLVVIAEDVDGEALAAYILNKLRGQLQVACVKAPGFGDNRKSILGDLAILTGGNVFTDELDIKLERATPDLLGSSGSITITKADAIFLNGKGSKDAIAARSEQIRAVAIDPTTSDCDRMKLSG